MRLLLIAQRLAQLTDAFGQVLFVNFMAFPEVLDQFVPGHDAMPLFHQIQQDLKPLSADRRRGRSATQ